MTVSDSWLVFSNKLENNKEKLKLKHKDDEQWVRSKSSYREALLREPSVYEERILSQIGPKPLVKLLKTEEITDSEREYSVMYDTIRYKSLTWTEKLSVVSWIYHTQSKTNEGSPTVTRKTKEERICETDAFSVWSKRVWGEMLRAKMGTAMMWYAQDEVNQEESEQNEVDRMKRGADSKRWLVVRTL